MSSPKTKEMQFGETEEAKFNFIPPDSLVQDIFSWIDQNVNPHLPTGTFTENDVRMAISRLQPIINN